ncbi:MAG: hypothetical protein ACP5H3_04020 [Candidatus Aenigmatarchaeota archaeon]
MLTESTEPTELIEPTEQTELTKLTKKVKNLEEAISNEIESIKREVFLILDVNLDSYFLKEFLKHWPYRSLEEKASILLDTLLNNLMKEVLEEVKKMPLNYQYEFLKEDLRNKIKTKVLLEGKSFKPRLLKFKEKETLLDKVVIGIQGTILGTIGSAAVLVIPETFFLKIIPVVFFLTVPVYIIKKLKRKDNKDNKTRKFKKLWRKQINSYFELTKKDLEKWLLDVEKDFLEEWITFYKKINHIPFRRDKFTLDTEKNKSNKTYYHRSTI